MLIVLIIRGKIHGWTDFRSSRYNHSEVTIVWGASHCR